MLWVNVAAAAAAAAYRIFTWLNQELQYIVKTKGTSQCNVITLHYADCDVEWYPVKLQQKRVDIKWTNGTIKMKGEHIVCIS